MSEGKAGNGGDGGEASAPMAPFDVWTRWLESNMGEVMTPPGASVPWLASPGISTGEAAEVLPEGAIRNDPLLQTMESLWDANPLRNVLPISWTEITRALADSVDARVERSGTRDAAGGGVQPAPLRDHDGGVERRDGPLLGPAARGEGRRG